MNSEFLSDYGMGLFNPWDSELDFARLICESGEYRQKMVPFPGRALINVPAYDTVTQTIVVEPKSFLQWVNAWTDLNTGFYFSIFDKGSQSYLVNEEYIPGNQVAGSSNVGVDVPIRQSWLNGPYLVTGTGELQLSVTNRGGTAGNIQLLLAFAEGRG